ncbi:MAG: serine/threonine-protein kinase, partial [Myxococcota bacterium]
MSSARPAPRLERRFPSAGDVLDGRYALVAPIGEGGMGTVWLAQHLALGHTVAVKLIEPRGDPTIAHARFMREAKLVAAIRHRNVVEITDFGTAPDGHPFMVMEHLEGRSLDDRLEEGPMGIGEAVSIGARVLSGLAAAHDAGILHHDLKPANVLLLSEPEGEYPKLIDFGISKSLQAGLESVFATQENLVTGTPRYMSPEQSRGLREMDARSDLFSLGIMLYEMLTCELPFDGENPGDILFKLQTERAPPVDRLRPDVPPPIARVVERALAKRPDDRFSDARSMRRALLEAADGVVSDAEGEASRYAPSVRPPPAVATALRAALDEAVEPQDHGVLNLRSLH